MNLPPDIAEFAWNYDTDDPDLSPDTVIMAILRIGTWDQIEWAFSAFGRDAVVGVIERDYFGPRSLPLSVRRLWGVVFWPDSPPPEDLDPQERWRPTREAFDPAVEVAQRVAAAVAASGLTQAEFASLLGTSQPRLSSYVTGKVVPLSTFLVAAEHLVQSHQNSAYERSSSEARGGPEPPPEAARPPVPAASPRHA